MKHVQQGGYSIILAIIMVGFMLMVTSGVFMLILSENKDTKGMESYLKAYSAAEGSLELALLVAKNHQYSFTANAPLDVSNDFSRILSRNPLEPGEYHPRKDLLIGYNISATTQKITDKNLKAGQFDIIPLFSVDGNNVPNKVTSLVLETTSRSDLVWNIVGTKEGMSGVGGISATTKGNLKRLTGGTPDFDEMLVGDFLRHSDQNYLIVHNVSTSSGSYTLSTPNTSEYFTREKNVIIASGKIGDYKQNIQFDLDTAQYLNLLKYSIFSE